MLKKIYAVMIIGLCIGLTGCDSGEAKESSSENRISVSEEIAEGISENVIPEEATKYNNMVFTVPEEFYPWEENTDTNQIYISNVPEDYSYISYSRSLRGEGEEVPEEADMEAAVEANFENGSLTSYTVEEADGYTKCIAVIGFQNERTEYTVWSYTYLTEEYVFAISFAESVNADWETVFGNCADGIVLTNVLGEELQ